jgi:ABC-type transport system involved in cytochrome c biogenesis permease subunit
MVTSSMFWLRVAACFYAVGLLHSILLLLRRKQSLYSIALWAFQVGAVLHGVSITELAIANGAIPVGNVYQTMSLCAFLIAVLFLLVEWRYHFASTAVAHFPLVFVMTLVAAMEQPVATWTNAGVRNAWLVVHIVLILAGYAALLLTAVASIAYLVQERRLKSKKAPSFLAKLPPLATLDDLISGSMAFGFVFITLGVIFGITWAAIESGTRWMGDAKVTLSIFTWALFLVMIFMRATAGWRGRKAAVMAIAVVVCSALTWVAHVGLGPSLIP